MCVNEVTLPKWCKNEHDYIRINREVLESKHVTNKLRHWIDMLFGAKQKDPDSHNVFFCYTYEVGATLIDEI
jgi:Beige/BEACH domain